MSDEFESNAFGFKAFIERQRKDFKIILLPNDDGSIELTKQDEEGGRYYPMLLRLQEDATQPSRLRLVIAVEDETVKLLRKVDIRQWVQDCQQWLEQFRLSEFPLTSRAKFLAGLNALYDSGATFGEITNWLNEWTTSLLREQLLVERLIYEAPMSKDEAAQLLKNHGLNINAKISAWQLLTWMGIDPDETLSLISRGLENIKEGYEPIFLPEEPIDRDRTRNRVREWKDQLRRK